MDKRKIIKLLEKNKEKLKERGVKKIGLFGSYLRGKQERGSDIDLIVSFNEKSFNNYMALLFLLREMLGKDIDLVIEENLKRELNRVKKEAIYVEI